MEKTWFNHSVLQAVTQIRGALFITWPNSSRLFLQLTVLSFFYKEGEYLYDIGCEGSGDQQFSHPTGLAFHKFNHLIVCITENRGIFTLGGKCVAELAGKSFKGSRLAFMLHVKLDNCLLLMWKNTVFRYSIRTDVRKYLLGKDLLQLTLLVFLACVSVESWKKNLRNLCIWKQKHTNWVIECGQGLNKCFKNTL